MAETKIITRQVKPYEVGLGFTRDLQGLALEAWTAALNGTGTSRQLDSNRVDGARY